MDNNKNFKLEGDGLVKNPVKRFGRYQHIVLKDCVCVETSYDGGSTWKCNCKRNKTDGQVGTFRWNVPNTTFKNCCMRIADVSGLGISYTSALFSILESGDLKAEQIYLFFSSSEKYMPGE